MGIVEKKELNSVDISFVIPCYRSEKSITAVVDEIVTIAQLNSWGYEIILVNDYSPDNVWSVICGLVKSNKNIIGINLAKNFGQHSALMAGFRASIGETVVSIDDDGQIPIDEVEKLCSKLNDGFDVVYGTYGKEKKKSFRKIGTFLNNKMTEIMLDKPKELVTTSFFAAKRFVIDEITKYNNPYPYMSGLILRTTRSIGHVEVNHRERSFGTSGYSIGKLLRLWINGFTAFSEKPLQIASIVGASISALGIILGLITILRKLIIVDVQTGYSSLFATLLFMGGLILLTLGLLGEYIGRIYISLNNSPQYVVRELITHDTLQDE